MTSNNDERDVIAERLLRRPSDQGLVDHHVTFERPVHDGGRLWRCRYTVSGIVEEGVGQGVDSLQALHAAMKDADARVRDWNAENGKELGWLVPPEHLDLFPDTLGTWWTRTTREGRKVWKECSEPVDAPVSDPGALAFFASPSVSSDEIIRWCARPAVRHSLGDLQLVGTGVDDRVWPALAECPHLAELSLCDNCVCIAGRGIGQLRHLTHVSLSGYPTTEEGRLEIASLPALESLSTNRVPWSDAALERFASTESLVVLDAMETAYTDRGLAALGKSRALEVVHVDANPGVTLAGLEALLRAPRLDVVLLDRKFEPELVEACRALRPDVEVRWLGERTPRGRDDE
jgi:hypothetical protein